MGSNYKTGNNPMTRPNHSAFILWRTFRFYRVLPELDKDTCLARADSYG